CCGGFASRSSALRTVQVMAPAPRSLPAAARGYRSRTDSVHRHGRDACLAEVIAIRPSPPRRGTRLIGPLITMARNSPLRAPRRRRWDLPLRPPSSPALLRASLTPAAPDDAA